MKPTEDQLAELSQRYNDLCGKNTALQKSLTESKEDYNELQAEYFVLLNRYIDLWKDLKENKKELNKQNQTI